MTLLSVNLNKIALVRNVRDTDEPDILAPARTCVQAGAGGITVHPRPDRRHTRPADVLRLADLLRGESNAEFNVEGNPFPNFLELVCAARPTQCTLVRNHAVRYHAALAGRGIVVRGWSGRPSMEVLL